MADTNKKKVKLPSGWAYFVKQSDGKWHKVTKQVYDATPDDHRSSPGGAWSRPAGRAMPPVARGAAGPRSRTVGPADDEPDDTEDADDVDDPYGDLQAAYDAAYSDGFVSGADYIGDDSILTPEQEQLMQTALYEKTMRDAKAKDAATKKQQQLQKAAQYASNPAAAVYDGIKAVAEKVADTTVAKTKQSVVNAEASDWLPIIAVVGILIVGSKRKR